MKDPALPTETQWAHIRTLVFGGAPAPTAAKPFPAASPPCGLSAAEAARRLAAEGANLLPGSAPKSGLAIVLKVVMEPMFLMLLAAGGIYLALGDPAEALFLLGFVFVVIGITLAQERKSARRSARWSRCANCRRRARWSSGTGRRSASPAPAWCAATCWCCTRATASPPMPGFSTASWRWTNRC